MDPRLPVKRLELRTKRATFGLRLERSNIHGLERDTSAVLQEKVAQTQFRPMESPPSAAARVQSAHKPLNGRTRVAWSDLATFLAARQVVHLQYHEMDLTPQVMPTRTEPRWRFGIYPD